MSLATAMSDQTTIPLPDARIAAELQAAQQEFTRPRQQIEDAFLDIGRKLIDGNNLLRGITAAFENLASGLEGAESTDSFGAFETMARRVLAMSKCSTADTRDLTPLIAQIAGIRRPVAELQRAVRSIGVIAMETRISATHLRGKHDFDAFTADIAHLAEQSSKTAQDFASVYEQLVTTLQAAEAKRAEVEATQKRALHGLSERLEASLAAISDRRRQAQAASREIGTLFGRIQAGISSIVTALQIGDITRQRIEHVEEKLATLLDPSEVSVRAPDGNVAALVAAVCRLVSALAEEATKDFEKEAGRIVEIIGQVAADAADIVMRSRRIHQETVEANAAALSELSEEVRRACRLMRECEMARIQLDQAAQDVTVSLADLLRSVKAVQRIKGGMQIVGINMALKCSGLGAQGNTLNVIAHELRELADATVMHANTAVACLDHAATLANALTAIPGDGNLGEIEGLEAEMGNADGVSRDGHLMAEALDRLVRDGTQVSRLLQEAAGQITIQKDIGSAVRAAIAHVEQIRLDAAAAHAAIGGGDLQEAEERALAQLGHRYTMASERALHDRHAGIAVKSRSPLPIAPAATEPDLDDIFL